MESQSAVRKHSNRKKAPRRVAEKQKSGDKRRLTQLLVSLCLFLLVFSGRNAFSPQLNDLDELIGKDTDFAAAFRQLGQAVSDGTPVGQMLKEFGVSLSGGGQEEPPAAEKTPGTQELPVPLPLSDRLGLMETTQFWVGLADTQKEQSSEEPGQPTPEPTAQVVTAMAQTYGENGEKLPSNVSFQYYELGLEKTAVPVMGQITSGFGYRTSPITGKREFHLALDIAASEGTKIGAFADGVVEYIGESKEFGLYLKLNHANNVSTFYAHCSKLLVQKGERVSCGQTVALVGSTGNATGAHLHLTILKDNIRLDPHYYVDL